MNSTPDNLEPPANKEMLISKAPHHVVGHDKQQQDFLLGLHINLRNAALRDENAKLMATLRTCCEVLISLE